MLKARFDMGTGVTLSDGKRGRVIGIYFHGKSEEPQYLIERKDEAGVLYQVWAAETSFARREVHGPCSGPGRRGERIASSCG